MRSLPTIPRRPRLAGVAAYVAIALCAFAYLAATSDAPRTHFDTARDWLMARDCLDGRYVSVGPGTSVLDLRQGALWIHFLAAGLGLGLDAVNLQRAVLLFQALGALALVATARALTGRWRGGLLALTYVVLLRAVEAGDILWNPQIAHPGVALFVAGWVLTANGRGLCCSALAGLGFALATLGHVFGIVLFPLLVGGALIAAVRPLLSLLVAMSVAALVIILDSPETLHINASVFAKNGLATPFALATAAAAGLALALRAPWRRLDVSRRTLLALAGLFGVLLLAGLGVPAYLDQPRSERYLFMVPPALALLLAFVTEAHLARRSARWQRLAAIGFAGLTCTAGLAVDRRADHGDVRYVWRLPEVERLEADLSARGVGFAEIFRRLEGPESQLLVASLAALDSHPLPGLPDRGTKGTLLVLRVERRLAPSSLPREWRTVDLNARFVALIRDAPGGLLDRGLEACYPDEGVACVVVDRAWHDQPPPNAKYTDREYPSTLPLELGRYRATGRSTWRLPVDASSGAVRVTLPEATWDGCTWSFETGAAEIVRQQNAEPQSITLSTVLGGRCFDRRSPPPLIVGPADDPVIQAFLTLPGG